jgi:hypothetical protein
MNTSTNPNIHRCAHPCHEGKIEYMSQISILEAKSGKWVSAIQWLTDYQTLEKANVRQNSHAPREHHDACKSNLQGNPHEAMK